MIVFLLLVIILRFILKEKYCYNFAFSELDRKGIKLGEVSADFNGGVGGYSPLQVVSVPSQKEWEQSYVKCLGEFNLLSIRSSILMKSYPYYQHFIDW